MNTPASSWIPGLLPAPSHGSAVPSAALSLPSALLQVRIPSPSWGVSDPLSLRFSYLCSAQPVVIEAFSWQVTTNRISQHEDLKQRGSYFILFSASHFIMTPPSVCCSVLVSLLGKDNANFFFSLKIEQMTQNFPPSLHEQWFWLTGQVSFRTYFLSIEVFWPLTISWHHNLLECEGQSSLGAGSPLAWTKASCNC